MIHRLLIGIQPLQAGIGKGELVYIGKEGFELWFPLPKGFLFD
jgi:hypothetical protein